MGSSLPCYTGPITRSRAKEPVVLSRFKASESGDGLRERGEEWVEEVLSSSEPKASLYHNFLSKEECEHLIAVATPHMKKSLVADKQSGPGKESKSRTSTGMFLSRGHDQIVRAIEGRIEKVTYIPIEHGEPIQVINYQVGQEFTPHFDGFNRMATLLMYLSDVEEGGETVFPDAKGNVISVKPKMGNALLFWSMNPDATVDPTSMHGSRPVIKGNKWAATKWLHANHYFGF